MSETESAKPTPKASAKANFRRLTLTVTAVFVVMVGARIATQSWPPPGSQAAIARYIFGDGSKMSAIVDRVRAGLSRDLWFILGYGLVLGGFAAIFLLWAISAFGRQSAKYVLAAVAIAVTAGNPAGFSVSATSSGTMSYQWFRDGVALTDGGSISGATTATLGISPASSGDAGTYSVVVTDNAGASSSVRALLTVN